MASRRFELERRLLALNPALHRRFTDAVFGLQHILSNYKLIFPAFTDHTELHTLTVIDFCNHLMTDQVERMNADEIDVSKMRNPLLIYDSDSCTNEKDIIEFSRHAAIQELEIKRDEFVLHTKTSNPKVTESIENIT